MVEGKDDCAKKKLISSAVNKEYKSALWLLIEICLFD